MVSFASVPTKLKGAESLRNGKLESVVLAQSLRVHNLCDIIINKSFSQCGGHFITTCISDETVNERGVLRLRATRVDDHRLMYTVLQVKNKLRTRLK